MSAYEKPIREQLARLGFIGRYNPSDVEAWMRIEHPTLDGLSQSQFKSEVRTACQCIDEAGPEQTAELRESYGF